MKIMTEQEARELLDKFFELNENGDLVKKDSSQNTSRTSPNFNSKNKSPNGLFYLPARRRLFNKIFEDLRLKYRDDIFEEYLRNSGQDFSFWFIFCVESNRVSFYKFDENWNADLSKVHRYYLSDYRLPNITNEEDRVNFDYELINSIVKHFELAFKNSGTPILPNLDFIPAPFKLTGDVSMVVMKFNR